MFFENEKIKFDYMDEKLTIKPEYEIFTKEIKKVEKIDFELNGETYTVIMIETIFKHRGYSSSYEWNSNYYFLSFINEKEYDNILLTVANDAKDIINNTVEKERDAEYWLWMKLLRDSYYKYGFEKKNDNYFDRYLQKVYYCCHWICNFAENDFESIYDSIVNYFVRDKIEETKNSLILKKAQEKINKLIEIYGIDYSNKETAINSYADDLKRVFNGKSCKQAKGILNDELSKNKSERDYWNSAKGIKEIDKLWCEQYIEVLNEKDNIARKAYTDFVRENNEAVLKQKHIASEIGDDFENEEFIIYQYKKNVGQKLFSINVTFDEVSTLFENEIDALFIERDFWQLQLSENDYVDKCWIEKYISVIDCKKNELRKSFNEFIVENREELINDINMDGVVSQMNKTIPSHFDPKSPHDSIVDIISDFNKEGKKYSEKFEYYNDVAVEIFSFNSSNDEYGKLLKFKISMLKSMYLKSLEDVYGKIGTKKIELLEQMTSLDFMQGLELYKEYVNLSESFYSFIQNNICDFYHDTNCLYQEFYYYGSILISNQLNMLNKKPSGKRPIPESDLNKTLMYFYDSNSIEEAKEKQRTRDYLGNKKNGLIGENEVNYALKWLDKEYTKIARKDPDKPITLYNPDFIDEAQEYDHIIVGKQGVFNIETKNYSGKLIVDTNGNWIRVKKDGLQEGERNPIQQLRRHEKLLRSIIGSDVPIINIICMAHPKMIIEGVENCSIPLVKSDLLVEFIETYKSDVSLSTDEINDCVKKIESYMN